MASSMKATLPVLPRGATMGDFGFQAAAVAEFLKALVPTTTMMFLTYTCIYATGKPHFLFYMYYCNMNSTLYQDILQISKRMPPDRSYSIRFAKSKVAAPSTRLGIPSNSAYILSPPPAHKTETKSQNLHVARCSLSKELRQSADKRHRYLHTIWGLHAEPIRELRPIR